MTPLSNTAEAHKARAIELRKRGLLDQAMAELELALRIRPNYPAAYYNVALVRRDQGRLAEAEAAWRKAISLKPDYHQAYSALGALFRQMGRLDEAIEACRKAVQLAPNDANARTTLATTLHLARQYKHAAEEFEQALRLDPRNGTTMNNYANMLAEMDQPSKAAQYYRQALTLAPGRVEIYSNLGNLLKMQGRIDQAIECYNRTLSAKPHLWPIHSNLLLTLNCHPRADRGLLAEHVDWANRHAARFYPQAPNFPNDRSPDRRLRIGYVSPDFRQHSVAYFIEPILQAHDHANVEIFCYSNAANPDRVTERIKALADHWRPIAALPDQQVEQMIRDDRIDILVDLAGHTANHRLLVFARRPAPVQVTYLGYPNTTGLATMDWRITDAESDPPAMTDSHYVEKLFRLPRGFLCYKPADNCPPPRDHSSGDDEPVTFGSFNNFAKVTPQTIELWSQILLAVPGSKILIKADTLGEPETQKQVLAEFARHGVQADRIELLGREPSFVRHLQTYHRLDIALDTFPYHGTTTTCEAMWMGVPVITLAGKAHVSRVGASLLTRVGLAELIACSPQQYVDLAVGLAQDANRRRKIAASLRHRMLTSPLTDAADFVRDLEQAYRQMWQNWCRT